ncbi:MAG: hypothetical protein WBY44_35090, partial [Bryobacteraceae bacterium]
MLFNGGRRRLLKNTGLALFGTGALSQLEPPARAQKNAARSAAAPAAAEDCNCTLGGDGTPLDTGTSELRAVIERYQVELRDYERIYALPGSLARQAALEKFYTGQLHLLDNIHFDSLSQEGKVDYLLIRARLEREKKQVVAEGNAEAEIARIVPFQQTIVGFEEARRRMETMDGQKAALALQKLVRDIAVAKDSMSGAKNNPELLGRAAQRLEQLRATMRSWYDFYALYDPKFVWWTEAEFKKADDTVEAHAQFLHKA